MGIDFKRNLLCSDFYMDWACTLAREAEGLTAPNPPVGALLVKDDRILGQGFHARAGGPHAEIAALKDAHNRWGTETASLLKGATLYVTLEPCNHTGRTGPCTEAIAKAGITKVYFAEKDPNPHVAGQGRHWLERHGIPCHEHPTPSSTELNAPFRWQVTQGTPWVLLKQAFRLNERGEWTQIPPMGQKTFTNEEALKQAHILRRRSQAIITGMGTVLADRPLFSVRHVPEGQRPRPRLVIVVGRPCQDQLFWDSWSEQQTLLGHEIHLAPSLDEAYRSLKNQTDIQTVLIEAGPKLSREALEHSIPVNEHWSFYHGGPLDQKGHGEAPIFPSKITRLFHC